MQIKIGNIGIYLREARKNNNLTISNVSEELEISKGYISRIENGTSKPSLQVLTALCNKYKINIKDIVELDFLDEQQETLFNLNISDVIMTDDIRYYDKKLTSTDKINILKYIDFIVNCKNIELKEHIVGLLNYITSK